MECCIRYLWCSSIILYNITYIAYIHHTHIYPQIKNKNIYLYLYLYLLQLQAQTDELFCAIANGDQEAVVRLIGEGDFFDPNNEDKLFIKMEAEVEITRKAHEGKSRSRSKSKSFSLSLTFKGMSFSLCWCRLVSSGVVY